jgi:hypothetical protein
MSFLLEEERGLDLSSTKGTRHDPLYCLSRLLLLPLIDAAKDFLAFEIVAGPPTFA